MTQEAAEQEEHAMTHASGEVELKSRSAGAPRTARLELEDGSTYEGVSFGNPESVGGEVVFTTGMVGYPETLTDPSFYGQIIVCTYPLVGNYGVPRPQPGPFGLDTRFESWKIHARGMVVSDYSTNYSHWDAERDLGSWLDSEGVAGITGIDTRSLTIRLRERGSMLGRIVIGDRPADFYDPNHEPLGPMVCPPEPETYNRGAARGRVALFDCGVKHNIIRSLAQRGLEVVRVPWDFPLAEEAKSLGVRGVMLSNGPGDPQQFIRTIDQVRALVDADVPMMGVCMGNQLLSLAIGAKTYKLKYGHRGQNQPVIELGTHNCFVTSQNHGFAVDTDSLPKGWEPWFENLNDGTNEGIRHESGRFRSVQFHPEACPGPVDTAHLFDEFVQMVEGAK